MDNRGLANEYFWGVSRVIEMVERLEWGWKWKVVAGCALLHVGVGGSQTSQSYLVLVNFMHQI